MDCSWCLPQKVKATQRVEWIHLPSDNISPRGWDLGTIARENLCDDHAAGLVRTSSKRYVITPLGARRGNVEQGEQQQRWNLDAPDGTNLSGGTGHGSR